MNTFDRILLVGSKGMLANAIRRALEARGKSVTGFDVPDIDITSPDSVAQIFKQTNPTLVINCAAYTNVDGCEKNRLLADAVNGTGVGNLAIASKQIGATLVHYSTDYVFDGTLRRPLKPNDPVGPVSAYGIGKLLGEQRLQQNAPPGWLLLRTAWLYGPSGNNFPQAILNAAKNGKPLRVVADQFGSPTFTQDLAEATINLLDTSASGIFHLTNSGDTNWFEFAKAVLDEFGINYPVEAITADDWKKIKPDSATRPAYSVLDINEYTRATGKPMPHWRDGLKRYRAAIAS